MIDSKQLGFVIYSFKKKHTQNIHGTYRLDIKLIWFFYAILIIALSLFSRFERKYEKKPDTPEGSFDLTQFTNANGSATKPAGGGPPNGNAVIKSIKVGHYKH